MKNSVLKIACIVIFMCITVFLQAGGIKEKTVTIQVTGIVRLVGSSLLPELVITGTEMEWYIEKEEEYKLKDYQHRTVTIEGVETVIAINFANGYPAGERRSLKNIKIISIQ